MAAAMEQLPKREQDESLETFHARYMKLMKDTEWARNLFDLDTKTEWPNNMTKIWKKKVNCSWAQVMLATTQNPYDAYNTLQTILGGSEHTLNSSFGSAANNNETKPQKKKDNFMAMVESKTNDVLLAMALKENQERLHALMTRNNKDRERRIDLEDQIKHDRNMYKRKRDDEDRW